MARKERQPWLEERGGVYYVFWYDKQARRVKRVSTRETDAGKARVAFATFLSSGLCTEDGKPQTEVTCGMVLDDYWTQHVQKKVIDTRRMSDVIYYLNIHFGAVSVSEANDQVVLQDGRSMTRVEHYCERRVSNAIRGRFRPRHSTGPTHRRELSVLVSAINHAVRTKRIKPAQVPYIPLPDAAPPRDRWLTKAETKVLFTTAKALYRPGEDKSKMSAAYKFVVLAYYTASRRKAIETLTWFQVDTKSWSRIALNPPGARVTTKRRPTVPVSPALLADLKQMYAERTGERVFDGPVDAHDLVVRSAKAAGLADVTPHTLRHTRATHLLQDGVTPWEVAGLLGDTLATLTRVYGHHCPDHLGGVMDADLKGLEPGAKLSKGE